MHLGILAWSGTELESNDLLELGTERGHHVEMFDFGDVSCDESQSTVTPLILNKPASRFDVIVNRGHITDSNWRQSVEAMSLLNQVRGVLFLEPFAVHLSVACKFTMYKVLADHGVPVPPTRLIRDIDAVRSSITDWGAIILKPSVGYGGNDVEHFDRMSIHDRLPIAEKLLQRYESLICQPFYPHSEDYRILLLAGEPVLCVAAEIDAGAWKADHYGYRGEPSRASFFSPDPAMLSIARQASRALGLSMSGVDLLKHNDGYLVLEANHPAGWDAETRQVRRAISGQYLDYIERRSDEENLRSTASMLDDDSPSLVASCFRGSERTWHNEGAVDGDS